MNKILQPEIPTQWPGRSCGIRAPVFGEVPLSHEEVALAIRTGLLAAPAGGLRAGTVGLFTREVSQCAKKS